MTIKHIHCLLFSVVCILLATATVQGQTGDGAAHPLSLEVIQDGHSLSGPWQFRSGDDIAWAAPDHIDSHWRQVDVPGRWPPGGYSDSGQMAWYRLHLQMDRHGGDDRWQFQHLGVRIGQVMSAYELYAGGELVGSVGGLPPASQIQYDRMMVFPVPERAIAADGSLVLALRVWGGDQEMLSYWYGGPYRGEFALGNYTALWQSLMVEELPGLMAVVLFLGFGFYHLYLYYRNPQLNVYLWFGLMALNIGLYSMTINQWKYVLGWSFITYQKLEFGSIHLFPAIAIQMLWVLTRHPVRPVMRVYQLSFVAIALLVLLAPGLEVHYSTLQMWHLWTLPLMLYAPYMLWKESRAGNREARTLLLGVLIFIGTCINDILIHQTDLSSVALIPYGFAAITVAMAVSLANQFTAMLNTLEEEVSKRTTDLSEANLQLAEAARADPLTGLLNRRGFLEEAEMEAQRFFRSGRSFSLVLGDVDYFKRFNDSHGHACGDYVLKQVAATITERLRDVDRGGRWGGEEFILLLPETDAQGAAVLADKLRKIIDGRSFYYLGESLHTTMTFGVASYRKGESLDSCIARADTAMYHGKESGRNRVMIGGYKGLTLVN